MNYKRRILKGFWVWGQFDANSTKRIINNQLSSGMITKHLLRKYTIGILTVIMEKKLFENHRFNKNYNIIGDFDLFTRLSLKYPFYKIDKPLAYYRSHTSNFFKIKKNDYIYELEHWIKSNKKIFKANNIKLIHPWLTLKKLQIKKFLKIN